MESEVPAQEGKTNTPVIVGAVIAGLLCVCALCAVAVIAILALLGPTIGTVLSNVVMELGTPTP